MINNSTFSNGIKHKILNFCREVTINFSKPTRKFVSESIYGITSANSCKLTDIGKALNEKISLKKTVDRLGRNLANFSNIDELMENYLETVRPSFGEKTMLLIDASDVTKPSSSKMEAIGTVVDGSTGKFGDGYWTMGVVALTEMNHHPIPVYEKLYPCTKNGGLGFIAESERALQYLRDHFSNTIPRIFDRGFDSGRVMQNLMGNNEKFIIRVAQTNRCAVHKGKSTHIKDIARDLVCTNEMPFRSKTGNISQCRIGKTEIVLSREDNIKLTMVVCKNFGENPLILFTNLDESVEELAVRIVKAYLMRWRIEEYHEFKKQHLGFEKFMVRSLRAIQNLDILLTVAIGYLGMVCEDVDSESYAIELISRTKHILKISDYLKKTKFFYNAVLESITTSLRSLCCGIAHYFKPKPINSQLSLFGF